MAIGRWCSVWLVLTLTQGTFWAAPARSLTLADRVAAQHAIEEVYWRHRTWPPENHAPKPSLDDVMPRRAIEAKVVDYLRKSVALERVWQRPLSAAQLQAELDRMTSETHDAATLRELFAALGNDPLLIAETIARPALVDRLARDWYSGDERFHGAVRARATAAHALLLSPADLRRSGLADATSDVVLTNDDPEARVDLERQVGAPIRIGAISPLIEDGEALHVVAIVSADARELRVVTATWRKTPFDAWWADRAADFDAPLAAPSATHATAQLDASVCNENSWKRTPGPPDVRHYHSAVWTGSELIVWGGRVRSYGPYYADGGRYNPATDTWTTVTRSGAPVERALHTAVWTGTTMIVWGGQNTASLSGLGDGGIYDPQTNSWSAVTATNAPSARYWHTAIWTGSRMIIWGSGTGGAASKTGGVYDPVANSWTATDASAAAPSARNRHAAVWTGTRMVVWGGQGAGGVDLNDGAQYDPVANSWTSVTTTNAPTARHLHAAVWAAERGEMLVWGGADAALNLLNSGARYDPVANAWTTTTITGAPSGRYYHSAVWTGSKLIVWGGQVTNLAYGNTGGVYDPASNSWVATAASGAPIARGSHTATWAPTTGEMIVWGGLTNLSAGADTGSGGRFSPSTNSWVAMTPTVPDGRDWHAAVWTGAEMILWGGEVQPAETNTGARFDPATATWAPTSLTLAPAARSRPTAVWTGTEMIVWGGDVSGGPLSSTGGRYNPATNTWAKTSDTLAPSARYYHSAVWTGSRMIIWGGYNSTTALNTGSRYDPVADTWSATTTTNAPTARYLPSGVWTGTRMVIWGGTSSGASVVNTGGRYDPVVDAWSPTATLGAPSARQCHVTAWTGAEMLIWSGSATCSTGVAAATDGGRYDPSADSWNPLSTAAAPAGRIFASAAWTGTDMIVWGGVITGASAVPTNTGGRYNLAGDSWAATPIDDDTPSGRWFHTAVFTGTEAIEWGGNYTASNGVADARLNTGSRLCACGTVYLDADGDGHGDPNVTYSLCQGSQPPGYVNAGDDCDDANGALWAAPGEAVGLLFGPDRTTLTWSPPSFTGGAPVAPLTFDTLESTSASDFSSATCVQTSTPGTTSATVNTPAAGSLLSYLVRARNMCPNGIGTLGQRSNFAERTGRTCP